MKEILLTKRQVAIVDDSDYEELNKSKWCAIWNERGKTFYAMRSTPGNNTVKLYMHRVIMGAHPGEQVDHKDFNGLHNWRDNLRLCSHTQNIQHQRKHNSTTNTYKGVRASSNQTFSSVICVNGVDVWLGTFHTETEAAQAYDEAAVMYFGEFAETNFGGVVAGSMERRLHQGDVAPSYRRHHPANTSGYRGVSFQKDISRYVVKIRVNGRRVYLGAFADPVVAARVYDAKAEEVFGGRSFLNFPEDGNGEAQ